MNDNAKKWVAALRSGEYQQGQFNLRTGDKFCCLGVACDVYIKEGNNLLVEQEGIAFAFGKEYGVLPAPVQKWLGLKNHNGQYGFERTQCLSHHNDVLQLSFAQIADFIEANKTLFEKEFQS